MKKIKLQEMRLKREITQDVMANLLDMTQATYSRKERGLTKITIEEWNRIAKVLGVDKSEVAEENTKKDSISTNFTKRFTTIPNSLLDQIAFLTKENLELKEKLRKFENQDN
ncbi:helix-turn-helix domain-containing protein [Flavobacterium sp. LAR06]|uniref:helix-turn-helix domain-containing protein n=1 Tax=Flavobacterium sp. LAR06 TaxID=3064897 RepID=UPI0035C0AFFC